MIDQSQLKKRFVLSARLTLVSGAVASAAVYLAASPTEQNQLLEGFRDSKAYRHELEAYGGKLSLVADELTRWAASLWQGETLAFTIAAISLLISLTLFWLASRIPPAIKG